MSTLPRLLLITNRHQMQPSFESAFEAALLGGARLIQLREKDLTPCGVLQLAKKSQCLCEAHGARLLINSRSDIAAVVGAGVHLPENDIPACSVRGVLGPHALCGVSVHSPDAAKRAVDEGADYLIFGSIFPTASHPGDLPQGLEVMRQVAGAVERPVFAIGGINATNIHSCLEAGAYGVAVISAVWSTPDIAASVRTLKRAIGDD